MMEVSPVYALVEYEDAYVQPLLLEALQTRLPADALILIDSAAGLPNASSRFLQWRQYESIDFEQLMGSPATCQANSYVIRKALIRKHYLAATVAHWATKTPDTVLKKHIAPSVEFEVDYAEFLDDALLEAYELKESWERNDAADDGAEKEWWILKPGMSERGQGIRLFSSEHELQEIFEEWDPPSDDEEDEEEDDSEGAQHITSQASLTKAPNPDEGKDGIITSQLRHFVAQPYIHPPLLLPAPHASAERKFHIRTYVIVVGALKVYVYKEMLALFAGKPYAGPSADAPPNEDLSSHLTNTCLQSGEREGSVHRFWSLPQTLPGLKHDAWRDRVFDQICSITGELFEAAVRSMGIHFQALPNAFEIFGLDFLVDAEGVAWLLEVNAFPDFAQTGADLQDMIRGLFCEVVDVGVAPFFGLPVKDKEEGHAAVREVLNIDLGRR